MSTAAAAVKAPVAAERPMRRDAARNRELVLAAAREMLALEGTDASTKAIAARAGVGIGTVYRHFPSKQDLVTALVDRIIGDLVAAARDALARDDGSGLEYFLRDLAASFVEHHAYAQTLMDYATCAQAATLRHLLAQLHRQAVKYSVVDLRITFGDVMTFVWSLHGVAQTSVPSAPRAWERHLAIHLVGWRPDGVPEPLPPSLTRRELDDVAARAQHR